jgi:hypothetical protein
MVHNMISQLELEQQVEVDTPKGRGRLFISKDYGTEIESIFVVILYNGEFWEFRNDQIRATSNMTMRRDKHDN